jgi:hypothetical protein
MPHLPADILTGIFIIVREESGLGILAHISKVCKLWREVVEPVLMAHVVLRNDTLSNFIDYHGEASQRLSMIKSLTLRIQVLSATSLQRDRRLYESYRLHGYTQTQSLERTLNRFIALTFPQFVSLNCLSVFVDTPSKLVPTPYLIGFRLQPGILVRLLRALPAACTSLELDTACYDWSPERKSQHLCPEIWAVLPRLRHVKLKVRNLCSRVLLRNPLDPDGLRNEPDLKETQPLDFENLQLASHLSTLSICIIPRYRAAPSSPCPDLQADLDRGQKQPLGYSRWGPRLLVSNLALAYKLGRFPRAQKLEIIQDRTSGLPQPELDLDAYHSLSDQVIEHSKLYEYSILIRDCIEDKTYPMPLRHINYVSNPVYGLYDKTDTCVIGHQRDLLQHAENTVWDETVYGARLPFGASDTARAGATPKPPPKFYTRKEWRKLSKHKMISWRREEGRKGVKIRRVISLDGADVDFDYTMMPLLPAAWEPIPGDDRGVM